MTSPLSPDPKNNSLYSLGCIVAAVSVSETLVILLLEAVHQQGIVLSPLQDAVLNIAMLTALSSALLWFLAVRPLALQIAQAHTTFNGELLEALENHVLLSIADVQGRIVYVNDMFCKVSGYTQHELIGQDHRIVNSGYHDQDYIRNMWRTIAGGKVWRGEFCNRRKDGELYWVDSTIVPSLDKDGKPKQYISIRRDTTARKANELKLAALKRALDASSEMILITDAEGFIQYANPALCLFTGWTEDALIGQKPYVLDSPTADQQSLSDDMDAEGRAMQGAIAEMQDRLHCSESWSGRLRGRRRGKASDQDTLEYWAKTNITPILSADGALSGYVQIQHDVSKQVEQEAALQIETDDTAARLSISEALHQPLTLEQRFIQILAILFGLKALDRQRKGCIFLRAQDENYLEKFVELNEQDADQCLGIERRIAFGAASAPAHAKHLRPVGDGLCGQVAVSRKLSVTAHCSCGGLQPHGHYTVPIASGEDILGVLFTVTDPYPVHSESRIAMLTEVGEMIALALLQHQANTSLEAARDAALQVAQTKTEFLANMSHEIRTPMNGVLGMLDLLQDTQLSREQWDLIDIAANSAESLLTIINDILDFSKLEAGKIELEQIEFNLPELVEEVCTLLSSRAHGKGLELNCFLPMNLPLRWRGDPTRIRQVLTNLIGNAVKFTERGEVSVKVAMPENNGSVLSPGKPTALRFEITDTGIGISAEAQARLFQAFSQADSSTSRRYGGTGLGLSISKDLVVLMNGHIGVESASGQGSIFWFTLPLEPVASDVPVPQANFAGKRALIVDDNATNRMIMNHYLSNWGFTLSEADNAPAALAELEAAALRNEPYDLLLSDMQMPDMDGFALARAIIANPAIADTPRILLSSGSIGSQAERSASGFAQSLLKPVRQTQLFDAIIDVLQLPGRKTAGVAKAAEVLPDYSGNRVLVVEDNKVNQKVILSQLSKFQIRPDLANNGQAALERLERQTYDLVLMDCQMPVMDGYEATRTLREREITGACPEHSREGGKSHTPIAALTAHASTGEREKCLAAGMDDYLSKPVSRADLAIVLARWLVTPSNLTSASTPEDNAAKDIASRFPLAKEQAESSGISAACWNETSALERLDGDIDLLIEMIDLFLEEAPVSVAELSAALDKADLPALADAAHAIKGMAGHFCADQTISLAANLEHAARSGADTDFQAMIDDLTLATVRLIESLLQRKRQNQ